MVPILAHVKRYIREGGAHPGLTFPLAPLPW
jgi:hypothetical protein